ncbi:hypothetical protein [Lysinibacillus pakistanensis]|uniref:hypothetical protein n=1 Tax=Lysinibacillus pakistanensis TaxID=759811 RepID=UPI003D26C691
MNVNLSFFSAGVQTSTGIEELSLRTPRPVAIYLCESNSDSNNNNTRLSDQQHVAAATLALRFRTKKQHVAAATLALRFRTEKQHVAAATLAQSRFRTQLCRGIIDRNLFRKSDGIFSYLIS